MKLSIEKISQEKAILKALVSDLSWGLKEIIFPTSAIKELTWSWIAYDWSSFQWINEINHSDAILIWDIQTLVKIPENLQDTSKWEYWIICNIHSTSWWHHPRCARGKLIKLQESLAKKWNWWKLFMWSEPEAFFVENKEKVWEDSWWNSNYFNPKDSKSWIIAEIAVTLDEMWFEVERCHTEVWDDQFETNWRYDLAERTADKIQIYKLVAHKVARSYWLDVTFLPKPYPSRNGSWMHCHISVQNWKENLFYDEKSKHKNFSRESLQFLQWILNNIRWICAIANSAEVSYSRLVPWYEAPCIVAIWEHNRSAACRIPAIADENLLSKAIRTEFRFPDPLANPYLLAWAFIAWWLSGLNEKVDFLWFTDENLFNLSLKEIEKKWFNLLPRNLWEAYTEFTWNKALEEFLWRDICEAYSDLMLDEIDSCQPFANSQSMRRHYFD